MAVEIDSGFKGTLREMSPALFARAKNIKTAMNRTQGRRSWSQFGEDLLLDCYLGGGSGFYVDVGAGHPRWGSNSFMFYRRGWSGVLVEPNEGLARKLKRHRRRDKVFECLAGATDGHATFFEFDAWQFSTTDESRALVADKARPSVKSERRVAVIPLSQMELQGSPLDQTFLTVDAEGDDFKVLQGNNWDQFLPRIVCVEEHESPLTRETQIFKFLQGKGYQLVSYTFKSSIYLHTGYAA